MIPYEELERALARWKAKRSGTVESTEATTPQGDETPSGVVVVGDSSSYESRDATGEVELTDAEVDHT